jgi:hypothetical protein
MTELLLLLGTASNGPTEEELVGDDAQRTICRRVLPVDSDDDGRLLPLLKVEEEEGEGRPRRRRLALVWWWWLWRLQDGLSRGSDMVL